MKWRNEWKMFLVAISLFTCINTNQRSIVNTNLQNRTQFYADNKFILNSISIFYTFFLNKHNFENGRCLRFMLHQNN